MTARVALPLLLAACLGPGRQLVATPLVVRGTLPTDTDAVPIDLVLAQGGLGTLALTDADGDVLGAWASAQGVDYLRGTELGHLEVYDGEATRLHHTVLGRPSLDLQGTALPGGRAVPFSLQLSGPTEVSAPVALEVDHRTPPTLVLWTLDLARVLAALPWETDPGADGLLTAADGMEDALRDAVADPGAWSLEIVAIDTDPAPAD